MGLLSLDPVGPDVFVAPTPAEGPPRLFGGQVASQALRASTLTVDPDRRVHSMHSYFIRPGRPNVPLHLEVERTRDGKSFATRRVTARQGDEAIFVLDASFHVDEEGYDWQEPAPPLTPGPDDIDPGQGPMGMPPRRGAPGSPEAPAGESNADGGSDDEAEVEIPEWMRDALKEREEAGENIDPDQLRRMMRMRRGGPFGGLVDMRPQEGGRGWRPHPSWVRIFEELGDDPALHACALVFVSDMAVVRSARAPGSPNTGWGGASLDHAVWFHRPLRVDEWLLFSAEPYTNYGARGLARGSFHTADGVLVASFVQECLLRSTGMPPPP